MSSASPFTALVQYAFERVGLHAHVGLQVQRVSRAADVLTIEIQLSYDAAHPICCGEPSCYVPALRPAGLAEVSEHLRAVELRERAPSLVVIVTALLGPGFRFREPRMGCEQGARMVFRHLPDDTNAAS